ncbi:MAG: CAP domain-containing protein [Minisyncoccia bacterium]
MKRRPRIVRSRTIGTRDFTPRFLKHHVMLATGALVVCLFVAAGAADRFVKEIGSPYVAAVVSAVLVNLANDDRAELALPTLTVNPALVAAAQAKADDMATKSYFSHTSPEGYDSWHWFKEAGYEYRFAGENLAVDFSDSGDVEDAWMRSPTHRDNIVSPKYTEIGIAVATGTYQGRPTVFAVQMFGMPKENLAETQPERPQAFPAPDTLTQVPASVLGETTAISEPIQVDEDGDASVILTKEEIPWWGFLLAQPKETLQYAYYFIGLLILVALFFDIEWEIHRHHIRHAMKASMLLATMSILFIAADWVFFAQPILAALGMG